MRIGGLQPAKCCFSLQLVSADSTSFRCRICLGESLGGLDHAPGHIFGLQLLFGFLAGQFGFDEVVQMMLDGPAPILDILGVDFIPLDPDSPDFPRSFCRSASLATLPAAEAAFGFRF